MIYSKPGLEQIPDDVTRKYTYYNRAVTTHSTLESLLTNSVDYNTNFNSPKYVITRKTKQNQIKLMLMWRSENQINVNVAESVTLNGTITFNCRFLRLGKLMDSYSHQ